MNDNEKILQALNKAIKKYQDIEIGKLMRYLGSIDDLAYMSDEDLLIQNLTFVFMVFILICNKIKKVTN